MTEKEVRYDFSLITSDDLYLFNEGSHFQLYEKLGAHLLTHGDYQGCYFAVWAPDAEGVSVTGDFNDWDKDKHPLRTKGASGIWEGFIPGIGTGSRYKYHIRSRLQGYRVDKSDPFSFYNEVPPKTASIIWDMDYTWADQHWMSGRENQNGHNKAMAIYEMHLGSWMRSPDDGNRSLTYRELAHRLVEYLKNMEFTHVEFMPITEHPFYGSWGYQTTGYFAPTSRYGKPQDLMHLIDCLHQNGIGVILDWVPSHFPKDEHGLGFFDGSHLYEHADTRQGLHPDWDSLIFNYGRDEIQSFIISSAIFWLEKYHFDGLRIDAVASMLYLDYGRKEGEWIPNPKGGKENLEAIRLLQRLNEEIYKKFPNAQTTAEESTSWPMVSRPTYLGGLGFGMKWDMGWMHDTLEFMSKEPIHRRYHHNKLTFRMLYAFQENFVLPLSHDEVVYGKGSLLEKMPGDDWQKFANLRLLFGYMYAQPGKKLLFMGGEFGQRNEWYHETGLDWDLLEYQPHGGLKNWVRDLNSLYKREKALHELDFAPEGFEWIDCDDSQQNIISLLRKGRLSEDALMIVCNFTPVPRHGYRIGAPVEGPWREILNSDALEYGGSGQGNMGTSRTEPISCHGRLQSVSITLPPLGIVFFKGKWKASENASGDAV